MKASELRIGNYYNQFGNIHQANGTIISQLETAPEGQLWCKPIPLTEEWLLKFGFKQNLDKWFEINYFTDCTLSAEKMGILINLCSNRCAILDTDTDQQSAMTSKRIYYVHQIQNLFYALTGEELALTES